MRAKSFLAWFLPAIFLFPTHSFSQDWKEQYVTSTGVAIHPKDRVLIADRLPLHHVYPNNIQAQAARIPAKLFLLTDMPGRTFQIGRLTRIPVKGGEYKAVAVLQINDPDIAPGYAVDYYIDIEAALKKGEVTFLGPEGSHQE